MNTKLLRLIRHHQTRSCHWTVPGFGNGIGYHTCHSFWKVPAISWPAMVDGYEIVRSARLDWHRAMIKNELRALFKRVAKMPETV